VARDVRRDALRATWMRSHSGPQGLLFGMCPRVGQSHRAEEPLTDRPVADRKLRISVYTYNFSNGDAELSQHCQEN